MRYQSGGECDSADCIWPRCRCTKEAVNTLSAEEKAEALKYFCGAGDGWIRIERGRGDDLIRSLTQIDEQSGSIAVNERVSVGRRFNLIAHAPGGT